MRTVEEYKQILAYAECGYSPTYIERLTGIPRCTIRDCINKYGTVEQLEMVLAHSQTRLLLNVLRREEAGAHGLSQTYAYLLGMYLGDGYINQVGRVYRLRIALDAEYPNIIQICRARMQQLFPENEIGLTESWYKGKVSCIEVSVYYKALPLVFPQHGKGMKHTRPIQLEDWQQRIIEAYPLEFFRGLYHSDGSRFINKVKEYEYPRYQFTNNSADIIRLFTDTCDRLKLHWTAKSHPRSVGGAYDIFISRRADVAFLDQYIGPKS